MSAEDEPALGPADVRLWLEQAVDAMQLGVTITDLGGTVRYVNPAEARMHGYSVAELLGRAAPEVSPPAHWTQATLQGIERFRLWKRERTGYHRDGRAFPVQLVSALVTDPAGRPVGVVTTCEDISVRRHAEDALRESEERYALAARGANDGLWDWNLATDSVYYSPRFMAILGLVEGEAGTAPEVWLGRVHPDDAGRVREKIREHLAGRTPHFQDEHRLRRGDGSYRWVLCRGLAARSPGRPPHRMAGALTDITDRRTTDALTTLPNRALFLERLVDAHNRARRSREPFGLLFVDLDRFKQVNDRLGHFAGDRLLVRAARCLEACVRPGDVVGRLGGDEFAVLLERIHDVADATVVADRIQAALRSPAELEGHDVLATASIGIAMGGGAPGQSAADLLRDADAAMYRAKALGRARYEVLDAALRERLLAERALEADLRRAAESGEFLLHYQPIVELASGRLLGFEALLRWRHPQRGVLLPADFLRLAEGSGLLVRIGGWVIAEACRASRAWHERFPAEPQRFISVNLSSRELAERGIVERVAQTLSDTALAPGTLRLEVSENAAMDRHAETAAALAHLKHLGVRIDIDDFGTGFCSLERLHRLPVDALKVDRSFVAPLGRARSNGSALVRSIVTLAHTLGLQAVAEGVETPLQERRLKALHCERAQGRRFSEPVDDAGVLRLLALADAQSRPHRRAGRVGSRLR